METHRKIVIAILTCTVIAAVCLVVNLSNLVNRQNYEELEQECLSMAKTLGTTSTQTYDKQIIINLLNTPMEFNDKTVVLTKEYTEALTKYLSSPEIELSENQVQDLLIRYQDVMQFYSRNNLPLKEWTKEDQNWFLYLVNKGLAILNLKGIYTSEDSDFAIVDKEEKLLVGNKVLAKSTTFHWIYIGIGFATLVFCYLIYFIITIRGNRRSIQKNKTIGREVYGE